MTEGLIATFLGGLLALAGALIGPTLQRKHDRWLAKREDENLLREKAEQLFDELDKIQDQSRKSTMSVMASVTNVQQEIIPVPDLGKVRAIVSVYFFTASKIVSDFENHKDSSGKVFMDYTKEQFEKKAMSADQTKALQLIMVAEHSKNLTKFTSDLRAHVSTVVPRLK
jgi:gas vesicle protein